MSVVDGTRVGFNDLIGVRAGVSEVAQDLGERLLADVVVVHAENQDQALYDERVEARVCTPPEEIFGDEGGAEIRAFANYMSQHGFPGATRVSPVEEKPKVEDQAPVAQRKRYLLDLDLEAGNDGAMPVRRHKAALAAITGKARAASLAAAEKEPAYAYVFGIGTTDVLVDEDGGLDGNHWVNSRPTPAAPAVIIRRGETGQFDVVEVGVVETTLNPRTGEIVPTATSQPLPFYPGTTEGVDFRVGAFRNSVALPHLVGAEMSDDVRALLPEHPRGAVFMDADGDLVTALTVVAKVGMSKARPAAPAVARRPFPGSGMGNGGQGSGGVVLAGSGEVVAVVPDLETVPTTPNGVVPAPRDGEAVDASVAK